MRSLPFLVLFGGAVLHAALWPAQFANQPLKSEQPAQTAGNPGIWKELGLEAAQQADYGPFRATAYRFPDSTLAYAAWQDVFQSSPKVLLLDNYVVVCEGRCPSKADFQSISLPRRRHSTPPALGSYLPSKNLVPQSERYAVGPATFAQAAPELPVSLGAFDFGTEAQVAMYRTPQKHEQKLVLFSFPTPQLARLQAAEMQKLPGAVVRRSGPLVALIPNVADPSAANALVSAISYQASVNWDERPPVKVTAQGVAKMILAILELAGILIVFCLLAGLGFAGYRLLGRKIGHQSADEPMILLHLVDR